MFRRARLRLTILYIGLFGLALGSFSLVVYFGLARILAPTFELVPELIEHTNIPLADAAYQAMIQQIAFGLLAADVLAVSVAAIIAWALAGRTLRPIREVHARQRRFVADASHEMRTPLAAIRSSAEGALATARTPDELRRALRVNAMAAQRLTRITDDLLLLARSDDQTNARRDRIDLSVVVAESAEAFALAHPELPRARLTLAADLIVRADPTEIGRIVENLLDNAIRYSGGPSATPALIATRSVDRDAVVEVRDHGPGIAAADLDRIFEPFHRLHPEAGAPEGSGLGLAIARSLAQRNGGDLAAVSPGGSGATFLLSLPRLT